MLFFLGISLPLVISAAGKIFINRTSAEHIIVPGRAATDSDARRAVVSTVYAQEPDDGNSKKKKYKPTRKVKFVPVGPNAGTYCDPYTRHYYPNLCPTPEQQQGEIPKAEWDPKSFPSSAGEHGISRTTARLPAGVLRHDQVQQRTPVARRSLVWSTCDTATWRNT